MPHLLDVTMFWAQNSGGVRRYLTAKQEWLRDRTSWQHTIVAPGAQGEGARSVHGWRIPMSGGYRAPLNRKRCARTLIGQRPDLIEAGDPFRLAWSSLDAARHLGIPLVAFCHSNIVTMARHLGGKGPAWLARRYVRRLYSQFDLVLAPSHSLRQELLGWGIPRVETQGLGVDTVTFSPSRRDLSWRAAMGLPPDARVLIYTGRFGPEKNLHVLAEAVRKLGPPYVLVAVGAGPTPPRGERVIVLPFTNQKAALARALASADLFVHAGDQETFGLAALEAMACGCPVVARDAAGMAELVTDHTGVRVSQGTPEAFAQAIEHAFQRGLDWQSRAAREHALNHSWHKVMTRLLSRYQKLLESR